MPRRDGTGPNGYGPLTGRRMGNCQARNLGMGYGRNRVNYPNTKEELLKEKELLEARLKNLDAELKNNN
jgi:hypothetical protein